MKKKYDFCLTLMLLLMIFLMTMSGIQRKQEALVSRIAPEILRFHVLANSDSPEDQALKLEVKDLLLEAIPAQPTKEAVSSYIMFHSEELEALAEDYMASQGYSYPAVISLETCDFPQKSYGDMTFPAGTYDAVRVVIGAGNGQNFWCVLYPALCYLDHTYAIVPDSSKDLLRNLIPEDDFLSLLTARHKKTEQESLLPRLKIRFKISELFD